MRTLFGGYRQFESDTNGGSTYRYRCGCVLLELLLLVLYRALLWVLLGVLLWVLLGVLLCVLL